MADVNSVNLVILVGRVAGDVRLDTGKGKDKDLTIAKFSIATNEIFKGSKNIVEFHNLVAFGKRAETCNKWCEKGKMVAIKGKLRTKRWKDKEGRLARTNQVDIDEITFLGKKEDYADGPKEKEPEDKPKGSDPF